VGFIRNPGMVWMPYGTGTPDARLGTQRRGRDSGGIDVVANT
jgi:hypothetical protein